MLFGPLGRALRATADALCGARLWILLDEWSSLSAELQPFLADLLRRSLFPVRDITVKIAAHPERLGRAAASPSDFVQAAFKKNAFPEFVRAAEGIPRDAINLAALAAQYADHASIGIQEVRRAASEWYQRDKQAAITANATVQQLLRELIDEVVGRRKARTFLLDQTAYHEHLAIQDLCDARLLHVLRHGITMPNHPGTRYDGFAIDYGCYVALLFSEQDFKQSSGWYDTWLRARPDVAPDNFHNIERSLIHLARLDRTR